jgi:hypothetical protein
MISHDFKLALTDYYYLLERDYPQKTILDLIGTRYSLSRSERSLLFRGICKKEKALERKKSLVAEENLSGEVLHIDSFNVLLTIAAYLRGMQVFISLDGLLRDTSESHGNGEWENYLPRSVSLVKDYLVSLHLEKLIFYIDSPMENSRMLHESLHDAFTDPFPEFRVLSSESPDHIISQVTSGIIASSDSTIIERSSVKIFDLPRHVLEHTFQPDFFRLERLINL